MYLPGTIDVNGEETEPWAIISKKTSMWYLMTECMLKV